MKERNFLDASQFGVYLTLHNMWNIQQSLTQKTGDIQENILLYREML